MEVSDERAYEGYRLNMCFPGFSIGHIDEFGAKGHSQTGPYEQSMQSLKR